MKEILSYIFELKFLLPRETLILEKINKISERFNNLLEEYKTKNKDLYFHIELIKMKVDFEEIKTKEHQSKIDIFIYIINDLLGRK